MLRFFVMLLLTVGSSFASQFQAQELDDCPCYGHIVVSHAQSTIEQITEAGLNRFSYPRKADHNASGISPQLDHLLARAVLDVRWGPVVIDVPARGEAYTSLAVYDMEHFTILFDKTEPEGERFVIVHKDFRGKLPQGTLIRTKSDFPFVILRSEREDLRNAATIDGAWEPVALPSTDNTRALIDWTIQHSEYYSKTRRIIRHSSKSYTGVVHQKMHDELLRQVTRDHYYDTCNMFEHFSDASVDAYTKRAAGLIFGQFGLPRHAMYAQKLTHFRDGRILSGSGGHFVMTLPYETGASFWSVTRYSAESLLPINPKNIGGHDVQRFTSADTAPNDFGEVTITFSREDPQDGTYWMPVQNCGYYIIVRYYDPDPQLNGETALELVYKGTEAAERFEIPVFE